MLKPLVFPDGNLDSFIMVENKSHIIRDYKPFAELGHTKEDHVTEIKL